MQLVTFSVSSREPRTGAIVGDHVVDLHTASRGRVPAAMRDLVAGGDAMLRMARHSCERPGSASYPLRTTHLRAPIPDPPSLRDFWAFEDHARASAKRRGEELPPEWYEVPAYFKGNPREVYGPEDEIPWPAYTRKLDFECEVACVVGKKGRDIPPEKAREHIFGYMIYNDFSARDVQKAEMALRMGPGKGKDFANAFGPWILTADEAEPARDFGMRARVNGEPWSEGHFRGNRWGFEVMLAHASREETLYPGDLLGSGTYHKGCGLDLNRWIQPGDVVELEVDKLGALRNRIGPAPEHRPFKYSPPAAEELEEP